MHDISFFMQDDYRVHPRLTLNLGVRYDLYGSPVEENGRVGSYYLPSTAAQLGVKPGFHVPENSIIFQQGFTPIQIGLAVAPGTPVNLDQVHKAKYASTLRGDRNNFAPRIGFAWRPLDVQSFVVRGGYGMFYDRPPGVFKTDLQLAAPFFIYQNVPAPVDMANPYPSLNINPFQIPLSVQIAKDANGTPRWTRYDGTPFPSTEPFNAKSFSFVDPMIRTLYMQQWSLNMQWEPFANNLLDLTFLYRPSSGVSAAPGGSTCAATGGTPATMQCNCRTGGASLKVFL